MKYHGKVVLAAVFLVLLFIIIGHAANRLPREPLGAAMKAAGAGVEEMSVNAWTKLPNTGQGYPELEAMTRSAIEQLGIEAGNCQITRNQNEYQKMVRAEYIENYFRTVVISEVIFPNGNSEQAEAYMVVLVETKPHNEGELADWQQRISAVIKNFGGTPRISTCLVGWLDGKLKDGEDNTALKNGFKTINATIIDKVRYENFASYTGYAPAISDYLEVAGRKINVNMAMRYSPSDDRTYITIGSPVITREY